MNALDILLTLAKGERPSGGLLHSARLHAFGAEHYGEESIVEVLRRDPVMLDQTQCSVIASESHLAVFTDDLAFVADLAEGGIARLWRIGAGDRMMPERGVDVVFEPDLTQARGDVFFDPADHAGLAADGVQWVVDTGRALAADPLAVRARALAVRAFGDRSRGAALFAVYRLSGDLARDARFFMAAASWDGDGMRIIHDCAKGGVSPTIPWTPRVGG